MDPEKAYEIRKIALQIHSLLHSSNGLEQFRERTRQAACEYLAALCECQSREEQRLNLLKKSGVLYGPEDLPERPDDGGNWVAWSEVISGCLKKPPDLVLPEPPHRPEAPDEIRGVSSEDLTEKQRELKTAFNNAWVKAIKVYSLANFQFVKKLGFPNDTKCDYEYVFDLQGWIPVELLPEHDPNFNLPLPIPKRKLKLTDKFAGLSALYDAWFSGAEKIAPWGTEMPNEAEVLSGLTHNGVSKDEFQQATWYFLIVLAAEKLDLDEIPIVESWLGDVETELRKGNVDDGRVPSEIGAKAIETFFRPAGSSKRENSAFYRNKYFRHLAESRGLGPAKIRDLWNDLKNETKKQFMLKNFGNELTAGAVRAGLISAGYKSGKLEAKK